MTLNSARLNGSICNSAEFNRGLFIMDGQATLDFCANEVGMVSTS